MYKYWFDEGCSELWDRTKQTKLQWLQNSNQVNGYGTYNVRHEGGRNLGQKRKLILKKQN
jgi:hypothetical protein